MLVLVLQVLRVLVVVMQVLLLLMLLLMMLSTAASVTAIAAAGCVVATASFRCRSCVNALSTSEISARVTSASVPLPRHNLGSRAHPTSKVWARGLHHPSSS